MSHVGGGWMRVPYSELSIPSLLRSDVGDSSTPATLNLNL